MKDLYRNSPIVYNVAIMTSTIETVPITPSDQWFAEHAVNSEARYAQGRVEQTAGVIEVGLEVVDAVADIGITGIAIPGAVDFFDGWRHKEEALMANSMTYEAAHKHAVRAKWVGLASALPVTVLATVIAGSTPIGIAVGLAFGIARYASGYSAQRQIELVGGVESRTVAQSDAWFTSNSLRELPKNLRWLERYVELFKAGGFSISAIVALASLNPIGILYALAAGYSYWKFDKSLPPVIEYYEDLEEKSAQLANVSTTQGNHRRVNARPLPA